MMFKNLFDLLSLFWCIVLTFGYNTNKHNLRYFYNNKIHSKSELILYDNPPVRIFDNVVTSDVSKLLDICAASGGLGHSVYNRNCIETIKNTPKTPIESVIESILQGLNDDASKVEYWWRDEWFSLDAHKDIDEKHAINKPLDDFKYPRHAHVLYLYIGYDVEGPTLIWTNNINTNHTHIYKDMFIVPSVITRLLRFQGDLLHSVPRPSLAYIDEEFGGTNYEIFTRNRSELSYTLDDIKDIPISAYQVNNTNIDDDKQKILDKFRFRRSVLLFNTWTNDDDVIDSPVDISRLPPKGTLLEYQKICNTNNNITTINNLNHFITIPGFYHNEIFINNTINNDNLEINNKIRLKIGLLGDKKRRYHMDRFINLYTHKNAIYVLKDKYLPSKLPMYNIKVD